MTKPGIGLTTANIYGARLGDDAALTAARLQAAEIENPALSTMLGDPPIAPAVPGSVSLNPELPAALP
jgi:hypothetical protein